MPPLFTQRPCESAKFNQCAEIFLVNLSLAWWLSPYLTSVSRHVASHRIASHHVTPAWNMNIFSWYHLDEQNWSSDTYKLGAVNWETVVLSLDQRTPCPRSPKHFLVKKYFELKCFHLKSFSNLSSSLISRRWASDKKPLQEFSSEKEFFSP